MDFFMDPSLVLETGEDLRDAVRDDLRVVWRKQPHPFQYRVRSEYLVNLVEQLPRSPGGVVYNCDVKRAAIDRLGLPEEDVHTEGTTLSLLIYNAQQFRRSDEYRRDGFVPFTRALIDQAGAGGKILTHGGAVLNVREAQGKLYAFAARRRKYAMSPIGNPVKIIKFGKRTAPTRAV